jgi:hypothetical protein
MPSTRLSASTVCAGVQLQRLALSAPAAIPSVSPPTRKPYLSLGLLEPLPDHAVRPASAPHAVVLA